MSKYSLGNSLSIRNKSEVIWGYLFIAPWILSFLLFTAYPFLSGLKNSFLDYSLFTPERSSFIGFTNYIDVLKDKSFWNSVFNIAYNQIIFIPLSIIVALFFAFILSEVSHGASFYKLAYYTPMIVSLVVASLIFIQLVDVKGPIQRILMNMGLISEYTDKYVWTWQTMPILALFNTWKVFGLMMIYFMAGLAGIDNDIIEAAEVDGAGWLKRSMKIKLPLLWPQIFFFITVNIIYGLQMFAEVLVIFTPTGGMYGQAVTPVLLLYTKAFAHNNMDYAITIGIVMSILIFTINQVQMRIMGEGKKDS